MYSLVTEVHFDNRCCFCCVNSPSYFYGPTAFWAYMFVISKAYELGDTVFIVLRKQPLIFLHWYHHISVMIYVWYSYTDHTSPGRWFMVMNYTVHSFMYTYYAARAMRFRISRWINKFITSIQISQMVMGLVINVSTYRVKTQGGRYCQQSFENIRYCSLMYLSYFCLFTYFFYVTYVHKKRSPVNDDEQKRRKPVGDTAQEMAKSFMWHCSAAWKLNVEQKGKRWSTYLEQRQSNCHYGLNLSLCLQHNADDFP